MTYHNGGDSYCQGCDKSFINANALKQHLNSSTHRPRNIKCPFKHLGCKSKGFISIAALARHFDGNGCTFITRRRFNKIAYDLNQEGQYKYSFIKPNVHPRNWKIGITKYLVHFYTMGAAHRVTNGEDNFWTCTYDGACGAKFTDIDKLKAHLKSPKHEALMFRCPGCDKHFPNLGSACSHIAEGLQGCDLNVEAEMRKVIELITAVTHKHDSRARSL